KPPGQPERSVADILGCGLRIAFSVRRYKVMRRGPAGVLRMSNGAVPIPRDVLHGARNAGPHGAMPAINDQVELSPTHGLAGQRAEELSANEDTDAIALEFDDPLIGWNSILRHIPGVLT